MKLSIVSDLHIDVGGGHYGLSLPGGETLLTAGDICQANTLHDHRLDWLRKEFGKYDRVFMVMGNHEHYEYDFSHTAKELRSLLPKNVTLLDNDCARLNDDVMLFGGTMWTSMNNADWFAMKACEGYVMDYMAIRKSGRRFSPMDGVSAYKQCVIALEAALNVYKGKRFIVMTHHLPSMRSVPERFQRPEYAQVNHAFASNMDAFLLGHSEIELWVHGHTHECMDYKLAATRVVCNPRGYAFRRGTENSGFNPAFIVEV